MKDLLNNCLLGKAIDYLTNSTQIQAYVPYNLYIYNKFTGDFRTVLEIYWKPLLFLKVYYIKLGLILALKTLLGIKIYTGYYSKIIRYGLKKNYVQLSSVFL